MINTVKKQNAYEIYEKACRMFKGHPYDREQALDLFEKCAKAGLSEAMFMAGYCYLNGLGTFIDIKRGMRWLKKAARLGDYDAAVLLAGDYYEGRGIEKNQLKAIRLWKKAAQAGNKIGEYYLGLAYKKGELLKRDESAAKYWLSRALVHGFTYASYELSTNENAVN